MVNIQIVLLLAVLPVLCLADLRLPDLVSNGMVLQRDRKAHVWNRTGPKSLVAFNNGFVREKNNI